MGETSYKIYQYLTTRFYQTASSGVFLNAVFYSTAIYLWMKSTSSITLSRQKLFINQFSVNQNRTSTHNKINLSIHYTQLEVSTV